MGGCFSSAQSDNDKELSDGISWDSVGEELKSKEINIKRDPRKDREMQEMVDDLAANISEMKENQKSELKRKKSKRTMKKKNLRKRGGLWEDEDVHQDNDKHTDRDRDKDNKDNDKDKRDNDEDHLIVKEEEENPPKDEKVNKILEKMMSSQMQKYKERIFKSKKAKKSNNQT